jgi:biotin synthase
MDWNGVGTGHLEMEMTKQEIIETLLGQGPPDEVLFSSARAVRERHFLSNVVLRGVVELTNKCRVNCDYCPMRRDNAHNLSPYLLTQDDLVDRAARIRDASINVVFIQGGEIPQSTDIIEGAIPRIIDLFESPVEILLNVGNKTREEYRRLRSAGASSYILKHETANSQLYFRHKHERLDARLRCLHDLLDLGFHVGTGTIIGLPGQTVEDVAEDILLAKEHGVHMVSASPFVPAPGTPLAGEASGSVETTLRAIALMRLILPGALIPSVSALEAIQGGGQGSGLHAGANVLTVNFSTPERVNDYLIYGDARYIVKLYYVRNLLRDHGLIAGHSIWA